MMDGLITDNTNGCGAMKGFWKFLKPPHRNFFRDECGKHDTAYEIGGTCEDKKKADRELFFNMVRRSVDHFENRKITSLWWFITISFLYYRALRIGGKGNFNIIQ